MWTGSYDPCGSPASAAVDGVVEVSFPYIDNFLYVLVSADNYASSLQSLKIKVGDTQQLAFRLGPAVHPWLTVMADGRWSTTRRG